MFVFGLVLGVPGTVLAIPELVSRLDLTLASRGTLISSLFLGLLAGSAASGPLVDRLGRRPLMAWSALLVSICLPVFAASRTFVVAVAALTALGVFSAGMNTAANAIASELFPGQRGRRMNAIALAVAAGGVTLPVTVAVAAGGLPWEAVIGTAALLSLAVSVVAFRIEVPDTVGGGHALTWADVAAVLRQPRMAVFCLLVMLAGATEACLAGWTTTYLTAGGVPAGTATWVLAGVWGGWMFGRLMFAGRVDRDKERAVVLASVAGAACVLLMVLARDTRLMVVAPPLAGLVTAIVMPTILAIAGERYPRFAGTLFGVLLTVAQLAAMILPSAVGLVAERAGIRAGLSLLIASTGLIAAIMAAMGPSPAKQER
jgi:MFS family permease